MLNNNLFYLVVWFVDCSVLDVQGLLIDFVVYMVLLVGF